MNNTNRNWGDALNGVNIQTDTPFDALYAPNANEGHTEMTKAGVDFFRAQLALADQQCTVSSLPISNGCYTIKAKHSNKYLQPENANANAIIKQYGSNGQTNQIFQLDAVDGDSYKIVSLGTTLGWNANGGGSKRSELVQEIIHWQRKSQGKNRS